MNSWGLHPQTSFICLFKILIHRFVCRGVYPVLSPLPFLDLQFNDEEGNQMYSALPSTLEHLIPLAGER